MVPFLVTRYVGTFRVFDANVTISMAQGWRLLAQGWWNIATLGGFSRLYDTISKIRARHCTRNEQGYNATLGPKSIRRNLHAAAVSSTLKCSLSFPNNVLPHPCTL